MSRKPREKSSTNFYHITTRGLNKEFVFNQSREKTRIMNLIRKEYEKYNIKIYAYCIMPNHFHLLLESELEDLASFMAKILAGYALYYNKKHNRIGYVFQGRYRSQCIENEEYFWNCLRYIHMNPLKAKLCTRETNYKYSSAQEYYYFKEKGRDIVCSEAFGIKEIVPNWMDNGVVFIDTKEEEVSQCVELAENILENMEYELGIPAIEILDYVENRNMFDKAIENAFHISKRKAQEIRKIIKSKMGQG